MNKITLKRFLSSILAALFVISLSVPIVYAGDISSFLTDTTTGWAKYDSNAHMGAKNTSYTYASNAVKTAYSKYVNAGIALWGSHITCPENSSTRAITGSFTVSNMDSSANAVTNASNVSNHRSSWEITIYSQNFDSDENTDAGKYRTIAHEIGHVYGLHHVASNSKIMYGTYSENKNVTSTDEAGMDVMTHSHTHSSSTSYTYNGYNGQQHKKRCSTCLAYSLENHTLNSNNVCTKCGVSVNDN